jgi:hypothetical protein
MARWLIGFLAGALILAGAGCSTKEPVIWSAAHNKRHALTLIEGFNETKTSIDRIIFGLEEVPDEGFADYMGRVVGTIPHGLHRFHMDLDRVVLDMDDYPLETEN